jgi:N-acetylglutamate synthase-like GNAT family acetyltransferase
MKIEFVPRDKQHSEYDWADFSNGEERIGKARCKIENDTITICSINIYPEWEGNGYGRDFVNYCKHHFQVVVADRVRPTAIGFWETMGFCNNQDGAWIFRKTS